jgi:inorganic pyrophosphatase
MKKVITVTVDRPIGYVHHGTTYPINYGYVNGVMGGDSEEQDAYILNDSAEPLESFTGLSSQDMMT